MKPEITIRAVVELDEHNIASDWSAEEAFGFVVALDEAMASWDFTLKLADYFDQQRKVNAAEEAMDAAELAEREAVK